MEVVHSTNDWSGHNSRPLTPVPQYDFERERENHTYFSTLSIENIKNLLFTTKQTLLASFPVSIWSAAIQRKVTKPLVLFAKDGCIHGYTLCFDHQYLRVVSQSESLQTGQPLHTSFNALLSIMHIFLCWMYRWRTASLPAPIPFDPWVEALVSQRGCDATATAEVGCGLAMAR